MRRTIQTPIQFADFLFSNSGFFYYYNSSLRASPHYITISSARNRATKVLLCTVRAVKVQAFCNHCLFLNWPHLKFWIHFGWFGIREHDEIWLKFKNKCSVEAQKSGKMNTPCISPSHRVASTYIRLRSRLVSALASHPGGVSSFPTWVNSCGVLTEKWWTLG